MDPGFFDLESESDGNSSSRELQYQYDGSLDAGLGTTILIFSLIGASFNIIVMFTVRSITKRNCSKARLASSILIFNLSISDTIYSMVHIFSAVTMVIGSRDRGLPDNMAMLLFCNFTGILFNLTIRTSVWFLTMITIVRYLAVRFPLQISSIITKRRVQVLAVLVWLIIFILSTVPYTMNVHYHYSKPLAICTWNLGSHHHTFQERLWFHILLMVLPIFIPGVLITSLYLLIVCKVIQLKTVHHKLRIGNVDKGPTKVPGPVPGPQPASGCAPRRRKISTAISSITGSMSFLKKPLSIYELERYEKETESIDQDLMDFAVTALNTFNSDPSDKSGLVAYYINRFIVKTAGTASFERIQSNSFTEKRAQSYEGEECPISLNYYDCKEPARAWYLRRHSEPVSSVCADTYATSVVEKFNVGGPEQAVRPAQSVKKRGMGSVVLVAMKQQLNKDIKEIQEKGSPQNPAPSPQNPAPSPQNPTPSPQNPDPSPQNPTPSPQNPAPRRVPFKRVAAICRTNSILEECSVGCTEPDSITADNLPTTMAISSQTSEEQICDTTVQESRSSILQKEKNSCVTKQKVALKQSMSLPAKINVTDTNSIEPVKYQVKDKASPKEKPPKLRFPLFTNGAAEKRVQDKRINRLDMRLHVIIQSAFYTLLMITLFVICYMPWWLLSVDILCRMLGDKGPMLDVSFTWYCNLLTISYGTILFSACSNPVIYFYFAYKQAMLDNLRLKYNRLLRKGNLSRRK